MREERWGNQQEGAVPGWERSGTATGLWSESAAGRGSCGALGLLPTPKEEGTFSQVPDSSPS